MEELNIRADVDNIQVVTDFVDSRLKALRYGGGKHFFDPELKDVFPEKDFWICIDRDRFDFVLRISRDREGLLTVKTSL